MKYMFSKVLGYSNKVYWYPNEEPPLRIKEMSDSHLLNACAKLEPTAIKWATLQKEILRRRLTPKVVKDPPLSTTMKQHSRYLNLLHSADVLSELDGEEFYF